MKSLYVSDMDGTLLGADSQISERTRAIISELSSRGALITVATARTPATVAPLLRGILMLPPAIVMTGAALWNHAADGKGSFAEVHYMKRADLEAALAACTNAGIHPFIYTMGQNGVLHVYHAGKSALNRAEQSFYDQRRSLPLKRFHLRTNIPAECFERTILLCALGPIAQTDAAAKVVEAETHCQVQSYPDALQPETGILEVFAPGVTKAAAIRRVKTITGADRVVAFGDNLNDLPMLAEADLAVAVGNALPEVKDAADIVIEPNTTDSVARFIAKMEE